MQLEVNQNYLPSKPGHHPKGVAIKMIALSSLTTEASVIRQRVGATDAMQTMNSRYVLQHAIFKANRCPGCVSHRFPPSVPSEY